MTLRILAMSDTHGDWDGMRAALPLMRAIAPHYIFHLGDVTKDAAWLRSIMPQIPVLAVRGNCDMTDTEPPVRIETISDVRFFLAHGHHYGVKGGLEGIAGAAQQNQCACALFGHTHRPLLERREGLLLVNPGSLCQPRGSAQGSMALLTVTDHEVEATHLNP